LFINLRNHTTFSLASGAIRISDLVNKAKELKIPALAICDSQNLFGALEFSSACKKSGIQPIIGAEMLVNFSALETSAINGSKTSNNKKPNNQQNHLETENSLVKMPLIARNEQGYKNLMHLVSYSFINRIAGVRPHIDFSLLSLYSEGLIALSGGVDGIVGRLLNNNQEETLANIIGNITNIFPKGDFYLEISRNNLVAEQKIEDKLINLALQKNLPLVATIDAYFLEPNIYEAQEILACIGDGLTLSDANRKKISPEQFFQSPERIMEKFIDIPEAIANTINIAKKCTVIANERLPTLPKFNSDPNFSEGDFLRSQANEGLINRLKKKFINENISKNDQEKITSEYQERLDFELEVIIKMQFPGYFLIVSDFIKWAKNQQIPVGPGRGSGAGSLVAWSLQITDLDPIRFGLLFERFLNPERVSMPDFDIDFCQSRRDEVITYVQNRYNTKNTNLNVNSNINAITAEINNGSRKVSQIYVAQIITFGKLQARAVLKDVGRVLQMPYNQVDRICKLIPFNAVEAVTLEKAISMDKDLQNAIAEDEQVAKLVDIALKLEGLNRHASTHAAGVVIGDKPLAEICALYCDEGAEMPAVGYSMKYAENAGLVKFDFLGLKTLTVIAETVKLIKANRNIDIEIENIDLQDKATFEMLATGDSIGVFQIESSGMRAVLKQMRADKIEDIIALISLYRPGPMDNIPTYIRRKHGEEKIEYPHPLLAKTLSETYGVIVYQEQVMEIARVLAGYSLGGADLLRRAMGKKIKEEMDQQREIFMSGAAKNNINEKQANEIFNLVDKFAGYGFNKSHAAAYAMISYQTAFLKAHFLPEFLTASMNLDIDNEAKINIFVQVAKSHNIPILMPDVNESDSYFKIEKIAN
jgi:DNA polymerase-3 subunit alpha